MIHVILKRTDLDRLILWHWDRRAIQMYRRTYSLRLYNRWLVPRFVCCRYWYACNRVRFVCLDNTVHPHSCVSWGAKLRVQDASTILLTLGNFSNDDGDGNENVKKAIGLDWQNKTLYVHHATLLFLHFCRHCTTTTCTFFSRTRTQDINTLLFFSWTSIQSFRIQLQKNLSTFDQLNEMA